jgi:hypothetical protein
MNSQKFSGRTWAPPKKFWEFIFRKKGEKEKRRKGEFQRIKIEAF